MIDYDAVVAQHWDDERIREAFIDDGGLSEYHDPINGAKENRRAMGAIFGAWLQSVKAAAWDEGFDSGHYSADWESRDCDCRVNPYREANG